MNRRMTGAGVAGAAGLVLAMAPSALAQATPHSTAAPNVTKALTPSLTSAPTTVSAPSTTTTTVSTTTTVPSPSTTVAPDYGFQKFRVGVQRKDGSFVPPGTTTAGSVLTIQETGPSEPGGETTSCTTQDSAAAPAEGTATFCVFRQDDAVRAAARRRLAAAKVRLRAEDTPSAEYYLAAPGDTVTITQTGFEPGLVLFANPAVIQPCTGFPACDDAPDALATDTGLPPVAADDSTTTPQDVPVTVDEEANDTTHGAPATVGALTKPGHGTATVEAGGTDEIRYTPAHGFAGTDHFRYTLSTPNGSSTATVTVTVVATSPSTSTPPTSSSSSSSSSSSASSSSASSSSASSSSASSSSASSSSSSSASSSSASASSTSRSATSSSIAATTSTALASTGSDSDVLSEAGLALLLGGGLLSVLGYRRRHRGTHAD